MNKKLKITLKFSDNVAFKYLDTKKLHWRELKGEDLTMKELIYYVRCLLVIIFFLRE